MTLPVSCRSTLAWSRRAAALLRLLFLYGVLCGLLLGAGLQRRADLETDSSLQPSVATADGAGLPFAGVTIDLAAYAPHDRPAALAGLAESGFGWVRQRFDWGALEPQPDVFAWEEADAWIDEIVSADLVPLVVLDGSPAWARPAQDRGSGDNPFAPPADPSSLAQFAAAFADRYGDRVQFYQVWDEPNIAPHWGNRHIEPVAYAQLLQVTAAAIRAADPDAVIAAAALAPTNDRGHTAIDEVYFWQRLLAAGAVDAFDAIAIQPFGFGRAPTSPQPRAEEAEFFEKTWLLPDTLRFQRALMLRRALVSMGLGHKPIWAVRSGWNRLPNATWGAVTAQEQARYAVAAYATAWKQWPWLAALGWAIDQPAIVMDDPAWGFSLHDSNCVPAPVLSALQEWLAAPRAAARPQPQPGAGDWSRWLVLLAGVLLVAWRSAAAARLLPWSDWIAGWRRLPWPLQALAWGGLLLLYHLAVWPPLIGVCWLLWVLLCLTQPRYGLALAALLLPFVYQHKELHLVNAVVVVPPATAALVCLLPSLLVEARRKAFRLSDIDVAVLALLGISLLSAVRVWQWQAFAQGLVGLVLAPLGLWFAVRILKGKIKLIALALFGGGVLVAAWGLAVWLRGQGVQVDGVLRLVGPHYSPNHTALVLLRTVFLGSGLAIAAAVNAARGRADGKIAMALGGAVTMVLLALIMTGSRGALLLGLPVGSLVLGWTALRRQPGLLRWLAAHPTARWVASVGVIAVGISALLLWDRLLNHQTLSLRIDLWEASLRLWRDNLLLGVGPGGFFWSYPAHLSPGGASEPNQLHPHNVWLEVATTWGLLGFGWLGAVVWQTAAVWQLNRRQSIVHVWLAAGLLAALLAAFAHGQVDAFFLLPDLAGWNMLALGLLAVIQEGERV